MFQGQMMDRREFDQAVGAMFDDLSQKLRAETRQDESPFAALRRIRGDRYGHLVQSPFRYDSNDSRVEKLEDSQLVARAKARLVTSNRTKNADVDALAFARELEHLSAVLHAIQFPGLTSLQNLPAAPDQPQPGQTSYAWGELDGAIVVPSATLDTTPPAPSISRGKTSTAVRPYAVSYGWNDMEMEQALLASVPLPTAKAWFARYSIDLAINNDNYFGDATRNIPGYFTASGVVSGDVATVGGKTKWVDKTAASVLADIRLAYTDFLSAIRGGVLTAPMNGVDLLPKTLFLPVAQYGDLKTRQYSDMNPLTLMTIVENQYGLKCVMVPEMAAAFAGDDALAIAAIDPMIAGRIIAKPFTEKPPQYKDFSVNIPCWTEAGGVVTFKPIGLRIYKKI